MVLVRVSSNSPASSRTIAARTVSQAAGEMSQQELLAKVVTELDMLEIEYMVTGSIVSSLQGEPRSTHDIDIVVNLLGSKSTSLSCRFPITGLFVVQVSLIRNLGLR